MTLQTQATVRVVTTSGDWAGTQVQQSSNSVSYSNLSPSLDSVSVGPFPTTGRTAAGGYVLLALTARSLGQGTGLNVTVGGSPCPIVNVSDPTSVIDPAAVNAAIINNPAAYQPSGLPISATTVWSFSCRLPPGQGTGLPVTLVRLPDGATSGGSLSTIDYLPPAVSSIALDGAPVANASTSTRYLVSPDGSTVVTLGGSNLGACPTVVWASSTLPFCGPGGLLATDPNAVLSADQTQLSFTAPAGEGDGILATGTPAGWTASVTAANQPQTTSAITVGYSSPSNVAAFPVNPSAGLPTIGGVAIAVTGSGFGRSMPGFPQAALPPFIQLRVYIGTGTWAEPL